MQSCHFPGARRFVESRGGTISLAPPAGGGTTAVIRLPTRQEAVDS
jgi:signal transduction histidine kinase